MKSILRRIYREFLRIQTVKKDKKIFYKNNQIKNRFWNLSLRLPQFIKCSSDIILGENCKLLCWKQEGFEPEISIGRNFHATRELTIQCANRVKIGDDVLVASNVFMIDYNHGMDPRIKSYLENSLEISKGIVIEDGVWIGNNVIILPGVTIGKKAIVGAGSVVTKDIPEYSIAVGNPAKVVKKYDFSENCWIRV